MIQIGMLFLWSKHKYRVVEDGTIYGYTERKNFSSSEYTLEELEKKLKNKNITIISNSPEIY